MSTNASVTMTMTEYQRYRDALPASAAFMMCVVSFGIGLIVGMTTLDSTSAPATPSTPTTVVQTNVQPQRDAPHAHA